MADTVTNLTGTYAHEAYTIRILREWGTLIDTTTTARAPYNAAPYNAAPASPWVSDTSPDSYTITSWQDLLTQLEATHGSAIVSNTNINNKVDNTSNEVVAGDKNFTGDCKVVTPATSTSIANKQYVDASTPPDATETVKGIAEIATTAETATGTDDTKIITPLKLATEVPSASTTAKGKIEIATQAEVNTGTDAEKAVTPDTLRSPFCESYYDGTNITSDGFVLWNNDRYDTDNMHDTSTNQQYFVAQNDSKYDIMGNLGVAQSSGTGSIIYRVEIYNASDVLQREYRKYINTTTTGNWSADFEVKTYLNAGEKVAIRVAGVSATSYVVGVEELTYITVSESK